MIYTLTNNLDHITHDLGCEFVAEALNFPDQVNTPSLLPDRDDFAQGLPTPIEYVGRLQVLKDLDYPYTQPTSSLLISKRMLNVLLSVRPFAHNAYPVRIYSDAIPPDLNNARDWDTEYEVPDVTAYTDDFIILKLTSYTDCLDADNTLMGDIPFSQTGKKFVNTSVQQYAFFELPGGFPPVFLPRHTVEYFYTEEAKTACEQAGLKGLRFLDNEQVVITRR